MKRLLLLFMFSPLAFGQYARVDVPLLTQGPNVPVTGGPLPQVLWVANATVTVCTHPSLTYGACLASPVTTTTDATGGTPCPTNAQLTQLGTATPTTCSASAGTAANVGFWYVGGIVDYWVVSSYGTYGPFSINPPSPAGTFASIILGPNTNSLGSIVARGDSMVSGYEGNTDTGAAPTALRLVSTPNVVNQGNGGTTSTQACVLAGQCPTAVTLTGNAIPACTTLPCSGTVGTFTSGSEPLIWAPTTGVTVVKGTLSGIPVAVTVSTIGVYTFTSTVVTAGAVVNPGSAFTVTNPYSTWLSILWTGRNNVYTTGATTIESNIAAMVAAVPAKQSYLVSGILRSNSICGTPGFSSCIGTTTGSEWTGTTGALLVNSINATLSATYGANYFDPNAALQAAYNPALPTDVSDVANGVIPTSLKAIDAQGTLTSNIGAGTTGSVSTCNITLTLSQLSLNAYTIVIIDDGTAAAEEVVPITVQNATPPYQILTCVRGYGGVNGAHTAGAAVTVTEYSHLRKEGYQVIAQAWAAKLAALQSQGVAQGTLNAALGPAFVGAGFYSFDTLNTSCGTGALASNTTGFRNTGCGSGALGANTTGLGNTGVGAQVLAQSTTANQNTALGFEALFNDITGNQNTALGYFSLFANTGQQSTATGFFAGENSTTGTNSFYGFESGQGAAGMTATRNTGVGYGTLAKLTTGANNVIVGEFAGAAIAAGGQNTCIGYLCLSGTDVTGITALGYASFSGVANTGTQNVGVGYQSGIANTTGSNNVFSGYDAGAGNTTGSNNSFVGRFAGSGITTGSSNTALGAKAGENDGTPLTTTATSTFIGANANASTDGLSDDTCLGQQAQCTASHQVVIGASTVTDAYFGSVTGASKIHAANLPLVATLTTTAAASDVVTVTGMTASGHCSLTATNASAATNIATTYISAKASDQITVSHAVTSGLTYDVICLNY